MTTVSRLTKVGALFATMALAACDYKSYDDTLFSDGVRTGEVVKFSLRFPQDPPENNSTGSADVNGYLERMKPCGKHWEGELAMSNTKLSVKTDIAVVNGTGGGQTSVAGGNTFEFSVADGATDIVQKIHLAQITGHRVLLHYNQVTKNDQCHARTAYVIVGVTDTEDPDFLKDVQQPGFADRFDAQLSRETLQASPGGHVRTDGTMGAPRL